MLKSALNWLSRGIAPIPIKYRSKVPAIAWGEYQKRLPTEEDVKKWFSVERNLAIVTGWRNLVVVDFDDFQTYNEWQLESPFPVTYSVLTPRGVHLYFFLEKPTKSFHLNKIDVKAIGGYVLTSPSVHPSGVTYTPLDTSVSILSVGSITDILDIPKEVKTVIRPRSNGNGWGNDLVSRVKRNYPILGFFPDAVKSGDRWYKTLCPFHDDHRESFWIDAGRGICGCFAGCTPLPFDAIDLWAALNNMSVEEAIAEMQERIE